MSRREETEIWGTRRVELVIHDQEEWKWQYSNLAKKGYRVYTRFKPIFGTIIAMQSLNLHLAAQIDF